MAQYQVTGECAHIVVDSPEGPRHQLVYKGTVLPDGVPQARIRHLLDVNLIRRVSNESDLIAPASPAPVVGGSDGGATPTGDVAGVSETATPFDDPERVAARSKLPEDGSLPHHASGQPVWVEYLVGRGYDYAAIQGQDKPVLVDLAKTASQTQ